MFALLFLLTAPVGGPAGARRPGTGGDPLGGLQTGQWVRIEAVPDGRLSARCLELRGLAGDFLDDDWAIRGVVHSIDPDRREFTVAGVRVQVGDHTTFDSVTRPFRGLSDLRTGLFVDVEGTYHRSGVFLAAEVDDESHDVARQPQLLQRLQVVGRVERIEGDRRWLEVLGIRFQVVEGTRVRSLLK